VGEGSSVPSSKTSVGELIPVLTREILPATLPAVVGAKRTVNVALWLPVRLIGRVGPVMLNPLPETVAAEIISMLPPAFLTERLCVLLVPTCTLANVSFPGLTPSCGFDPLAAVAHPQRQIAITNVTARIMWNIGLRALNSIRLDFLWFVRLCGLFTVPFTIPLKMNGINNDATSLVSFRGVA
jgi:hypothetical protein